MGDAVEPQQQIDHSTQHRDHELRVAHHEQIN
jgi:hypothetical protein